MIAVAQPIVPIIGFLGAGKSTFITRADSLGIGAQTETRFDESSTATLWELAPDQEPALAPPPIAGAPVCKPIVVVDAVNFRSTSQDQRVAPWLFAMMRFAAATVINKTDLEDIKKVRDALNTAGIENAMDARDDGAIRQAVRNAMHTANTSAPTVISKPVNLCHWTYCGAAQLDARSIDAVLASRPKGAFRMCGIIRTETSGLGVDIAGRARQTRATPQPDETRLAVTGLRSDIQNADLDVWFTQAVVDSAHRLGGIACR